jgi:hypothetical protein
MNTKKTRCAFGVRCHTFGEKERQLYAYGESYFGAGNTYLILNVENKLEIPKEFHSIYFNHREVLSAKDFLWFPEVAWKCGDYCYYAMHKTLKGYDYFWLAEPDVKICHPCADVFFSEFEKFDHDFLATFLGPASEKLFFYHTAKVLEAPPMSCLFPITRLKVSQIEVLANIRKKVTADFIKTKRSPNEYPNDEIFLATVTRRLNFRCAPLDKLSSFNFMMFRADKQTMFLEDDVRGVEGRFVMHPVLDEESFVRKKERIFAGLLSSSGELVGWINDTLATQPNPHIRKALQNRFLNEVKKLLRINSD